ncbi:hypothetical protein KIW84_064396 [Lathyrus oleraceus]|uniref:Uncharacterized protein n=1 Tax=Pisum sativum TaxID=3888 RepID=A0A9D5A637_PEA|nr:hypothetical protein KIW84_064396 [Pisum sativum]
MPNISITSARSVATAVTTTCTRNQHSSPAELESQVNQNLACNANALRFRSRIQEFQWQFLMIRRPYGMVGHELCIHAIGISAVLPQYKNSIFVSSLPQSAAIPSGCGFGSSTSIPGGNYPLNPTGHS